LYQEIDNQELILKCVETSLHNNIFLHFAGGWNESSMIAVAKKISLKNKIYTDFLNYLETPVTGKPVGRILPSH
jgi:hypothetical protein